MVIFFDVGKQQQNPKPTSETSLNTNPNHLVKKDITKATDYCRAIAAKQNKIPLKFARLLSGVANKLIFDTYLNIVVIFTHIVKAIVVHSIKNKLRFMKADIK